MSELLQAVRATGRMPMPPARSATGPVAQMMSGSPHVRMLSAQRALLNAGASAPAQLSGRGGGKKEGKKKRQEDELVRTFGAYGSSQHSEADIRAAIQQLNARGTRLPKGHRSGGKGDGMNAGTTRTLAAINAELKQQGEAKKAEKKKKRGKKKRDDSDDEEGIGFVPRDDKDREPPPDGGHGMGGGGQAILV